MTAESDPIANAANTAVLIFHAVSDLYSAGFRFLRDRKELAPGPFQGKPACVRTATGRGVIEAAVERRASALVVDVHSFPSHIACDAASCSELVMPLIRGGRVLGVLDQDSPFSGLFDVAGSVGVARQAEVFLAFRA